MHQPRALYLHVEQRDPVIEIDDLDDWIALFYMQVQGSGLVHLADGSGGRLTYAGKNGYPYTSIGKVLIERGAMSPDDIDMDKVRAWLCADPERGRTLMQENRSYVFFRALGEEAVSYTHLRAHETRHDLVCR